MTSLCGFKYLVQFKKVPLHVTTPCTLQIQLETHNDSRQVGISLYNTLVLGAFGLIISLLLEEDAVIVYALSSICTIAGTTLNLAILFIPKVICIIFHT